MTNLLIDPILYTLYKDDILAIEQRNLHAIKTIFVPESGKRLSPDILKEIDIATPPNPDYERAAVRRFYGTALRAPNLKWIHLPHAGIDDPVFGDLLQKGVRLTNASGAMAEPIAATAIGALLYFSRGFPRWVRSQKSHMWDQYPFQNLPKDIRQQHILIFGLGAIGSEIARLGNALGFKVTGVRRSAKRLADNIEQLITPDQVKTILPDLDWLIVSSPLTEATHNFFSDELLDLLPSNAGVINIARGEIIDEDSLIARLSDGRLSCAYLDVFEEEPLNKESPLWDLENVIISPHDSGATSAVDERLKGYFLRNLELWIKDEPLENEVFER
tara:strand:+ start:6252 stop:7244 length:993 start_codon:yes stop_codon:yes gene_type:complete